MLTDEEKALLLKILNSWDYWLQDEKVTEKMMDQITVIRKKLAE